MRDDAETGSATQAPASMGDADPSTWSEASPCQSHDLLRRLPGVGARLDAVLLEDGPALLLPRTAEAHDQRHLHAQTVARLDEPPRHLVAAGDATEHVEQHALDTRVHQDHLEGVLNHLRPRPAADVAEVGGLAPGPLNQVQRAH